MTATAESRRGRTEYSIAVPPETQVLKPVAAGLSDLLPGERVVHQAMQGSTGALSTSAIASFGSPRT